MTKSKVNLGDEVKDKVTGFKGIVTSITLFLNGCTRCGVQPKMGKDGKVPDGLSFDEPQLEVVKRKAVASENQNLLDEAANPRAKTGGPMGRAPTQARTPVR